MKENKRTREGRGEGGTTKSNNEMWWATVVIVVQHFTSAHTRGGEKKKRDVEGKDLKRCLARGYTGVCVCVCVCVVVGGGAYASMRSSSWEMMQGARLGSFLR